MLQECGYGTIQRMPNVDTPNEIDDTTSTYIRHDCEGRWVEKGMSLLYFKMYLCLEFVIQLICLWYVITLLYNVFMFKVRNITAIFMIYRWRIAVRMKEKCF
ncbi:hypothetical protein IC582_010426 [Cucumis melo]